MKKLLLIGSLLVLEAICATAAETNNLWFPVGEKFRYRLYWGIIPVGTAEFSSEWIEMGGVRHISLKAIAKTTSIVARIYPVEDYIESIVNPETFLPIIYIQRLREGRHRRRDMTTFDHAGGKACCKSELDGSEKVLDIDRDTRDVLSLVYYMRSKGFDKGQREKFRVLVDDKLYDLDVEGVAHESVRVKGGGRVPCLKVKPEARFGEIFVRKGRVFLWFSMDESRICARMTAKVMLADVKAVLSGVENAGQNVFARGLEE